MTHGTADNSLTPATDNGSGSTPQLAGYEDCTVNIIIIVIY